MAGAAAVGSTGSALGSFHVHRGHVFEGFRIERAGGEEMLVARCACGEVLDVADAAYAVCPECSGRAATCTRCGGTGSIVDHAALVWRLPDGREERQRHADDA